MTIWISLAWRQAISVWRSQCSHLSPAHLWIHYNSRMLQSAMNRWTSTSQHGKFHAQRIIRQLAHAMDVRALMAALHAWSGALSQQENQHSVKLGFQMKALVMWKRRSVMVVFTEWGWKGWWMERMGPTAQLKVCQAILFFLD